jgi:predicted nucleic acid-binding protein
MTVVDASVVVEMLLQTRTGQNAFDQVAAAPSGMQAPHLLDIEVTHALRRLFLKREISEQTAATAVKNLPHLQIERYPHLLLVPRIWELRDSLSGYDATYVALAESLGQPILTCDARLSRSHGHRARIELLG